MIDLDYLKNVLQNISDGSYSGIETNSLIDKVVGSDFEDDEFLKFKYHMDEAWEAGLLKGRDGPGANGWGYQGKAPRITLISIPLVLTPIGSDTLAEMKKPKGLERLKMAVLSAGGTAGTEGLRMGVGEFLRSAVS